MSNDNITCQIKRSDRPCLVCSGHMDLIETRPSKFNIFNALPLVCSSEGIDCLDCPKCGFKTTTVDYQYLRMCKNERQGIFQNTTQSLRKSERTRKRSEYRRENSGRSHSSSLSSNERTCSSCQATLESSSWQFCPSCGSKCSASASTSAAVSTATNGINEIIQTDYSKNSIITNDNESDDHNNHNEPNSSNSYDSGIVRMVTPPKRASISDYGSPVQMQY